MSRPSFASGFLAGAAAMLITLLIMAAFVADSAPNFVSSGAAKTGWGQSYGRLYLVTPAEAVPSQEARQ